MITDKFFRFPKAYAGAGGIGLAAKELGARLEKSELVWWLSSPAGHLGEYMALMGHDFGVNPWWFMVSAQREQSALTLKPLPRGALAALVGYVAQDVGRTALPGYLGVYAQIYRCAAQTSWYMGERPASLPHRPPRWAPGVVLDGEYAVEQDGIRKPWAPACMAEHAELLYTPHLKIREVNFSLAQEIAPQFL